MSSPNGRYVREVQREELLLTDFAGDASAGGSRAKRLFLLSDEAACPPRPATAQGKRSWNSAGSSAITEAGSWPFRFSTPENALRRSVWQTGHEDLKPVEGARPPRAIGELTGG